jgi:hypothetical protein
MPKADELVSAGQIEEAQPKLLQACPHAIGLDTACGLGFGGGRLHAVWAEKLEATQAGGTTPRILPVTAGRPLPRRNCNHAAAQ